MKKLAYSGGYVLTMNRESRANNINVQMKIMYALGIVFIVAGHCMGGGISLAYDWFISFHIGLFVFCSGYFYKEKSEGAIISYLKKKIKNLVVPLYVYNLLYGGLVTLLTFAGFSIGISGRSLFYDLLLAPIVDGHQFVYNMAGWFIIPLFMIEIINIVFRKILRIYFGRINEYIFGCLYFMFGFAGVYLSAAGYNTGGGLVLNRVLVLLPYWAGGRIYRTHLEVNDCLSNKVYFSIIFLLNLAVLVLLRKNPWYLYAWLNNFDDGVLFPYLTGFLGIAFWLRVSRLLVPVLKNSSTMYGIADNTFSIMINEFLGFMLVKTGFYVLYLITPLAHTFDVVKFKADIWYYYLPNGVPQSLILYLAAGIVVPILIQKYIVDWLKARLKTNRLYQFFFVSR